MIGFDGGRFRFFPTAQAGAGANAALTLANPLAVRARGGMLDVVTGGTASDSFAIGFSGDIGLGGPLEIGDQNVTTFSTQNYLYDGTVTLTQDAAGLPGFKNLPTGTR